MSSKFGCGRRDSREIGCVLLCKSVPVLTHEVLQIAEDPKYVGRLTTLAKSGNFSAVGRALLYFYQEVEISCLLLLRK